jgi:hypothetical protein
LKSEVAQEILSYANQIKINPDKDAVNKLFDELFAEDSKIRELLPLKYERATDTTKAKLSVSIFPKSTEISKEELKTLYKSPLTKLNKKALVSTGLFSIEYVTTKDGVYSNMIYPEFIVFNFKSDNRSNYKVMKRVSLNNRGTISDNPDAGVSAEYVEVPRFASKNILPQAFPISQLEDAAEGVLTEKDDMTFVLTSEDFEDYSIKHFDKKAIIEKIKQLAATKKQTGFSLAEDTLNKGQQIKIPIYEPVTITLATVKAIKDLLRPLKLSPEFNDLVFKLSIEDIKLGVYEFKAKGEKKEFILAKIINIIENYKAQAPSSNQPIVTTATFESIEKAFYDLNKSYFNSIGLSYDMYSKNNKNTQLKSLDDLVNAYKSGMDIEDYKPILPSEKVQQAPTGSTSTNLDYKKMSKTELAAIFNTIKPKLVNNPKYNVVTFYDFQAIVLKFDNNVIQEMINECI